MAREQRFTKDKCPPGWVRLNPRRRRTAQEKVAETATQLQRENRDLREIIDNMQERLAALETKKRKSTTKKK